VAYQPHGVVEQYDLDNETDNYNPRKDTGMATAYAWSYNSACDVRNVLEQRSQFRWPDYELTKHQAQPAKGAIDELLKLSHVIKLEPMPRD
jgi:hypothetical protein